MKGELPHGDRVQEGRRTRMQRGQNGGGRYCEAQGRKDERRLRARAPKQRREGSQEGDGGSKGAKEHEERQEDGRRIASCGPFK